MESHGVMNMSSKSAILEESSSNWLNSFERRDFRVSVFFQVEQRHEMNEVGETIPSDSVLSLQHLCQKLPKSVDAL